jgi:hypothetical protein
VLNSDLGDVGHGVVATIRIFADTLEILLFKIPQTSAVLLSFSHAAVDQAVQGLGETRNSCSVDGDGYLFWTNQESEDFGIE